MQKYYLGLDIGTESVGYAVTDTEYTLRKFKGEPMWGTHLFEGAQEAAERRTHRTNRRRIDRRQQRVQLVNELFALEIAKIDPNFFVRRKESSLLPEDAQFKVKLFAGSGITDREYHQKYPTIHHLILELMTSSEPHDVRLVYMACAWLVAHRGHFLFDFGADQTDKLLDFDEVYNELCDYLVKQEYKLPWPDSVKADVVLRILQMEVGISKKKEAFKKEVFGGNKISKEPSETFPYSAEAFVALLAGGTLKPEALFCSDAYADVESISLQMGDEDFDRVVAELGEDGELLTILRKLHSCAKLIATMSNSRKGDPRCISSSKVAIYERHKEDLKLLKEFVKKYCPKRYNEIFRNIAGGNYVAYSGNLKSCSNQDKAKAKRADKAAFSDFLKKKLKGLPVKPRDQKTYEDMMNRLDSLAFLPKQRDTDNRIIPQQLYRQELTAILERAKAYLPMLSSQDENGLTISQKLLSVFDFRIPYYVGPLVKVPGGTAWIERKPGRILPWNFDEMVDKDASERAFIKKMTNRCTYLPSEDVLPVNSLLYEKFTVLNELNNLKFNGNTVPLEVKQDLYTTLFLDSPKATVTVKQIADHLRQHGYISSKEEIGGLDNTFKSGLHSYHIFKRMMENGILTEADVEQIILHRAYTEDKGRMQCWLKEKYPQFSENDVQYILRQKLKGFGRLSGKFLNGLYGTARDSHGDAFTIIEAMWNTNSNLMQLLSDKYTYADQVKAYCKHYYAEHPRKLTDRLAEMYVSNAAKRPIFRAMDIISDVVKAMGCAPEKIFVEMARGGTQDQKGKRTLSRTKQLQELYKKVKTEDAKQLAQELEAMGVMADNRLQDRKLYLYYLQLGKCAYTGKPIDLSRLGDGTYNLEHIYPQSLVKDDSILNNLVLVESGVNGQKSDTYPVDGSIRSQMRGTWECWRENGLMTEEKYRRLTRTTPFSADEKLGFINRQLVETRQSTKVIAALLKERFPETEIVYVKAGLVSEFRQEFELVKCRSVNDLHHAKDAYLNIVVGNVYDERFTKKWFRLDEPYNVQAKKLFAKPLHHGDHTYWNGEKDIARVKTIVAKNAVHLTRYAFFRKGGLFDQQPVKMAEGLIPLKKDLSTEKYGGYNKASAFGFVLIRAILKGKNEVLLVPVELLAKDRVLTDREFAQSYLESAVEKIVGNQPEKVELLLNGRFLKINTVFSCDGTKLALAGKSSGGRQVLLSPVAALVLPEQWEQYAKKLESFGNKQKTNPNIVPDEANDGISKEWNLALYRILTAKLGAWPFVNYPGNQVDTLVKGEGEFVAAPIVDQVRCLMNILLMMGPGSTAVDLTVCGGSKASGCKRLSAGLTNWKKRYSNVCIIDEAASGLFSQVGGNLLDLL